MIFFTDDRDPAFIGNDQVDSRRYIRFGNSNDDDIVRIVCNRRSDSTFFKSEIFNKSNLRRPIFVTVDHGYFKNVIIYVRDQIMIFALDLPFDPLGHQLSVHNFYNGRFGVTVFNKKLPFAFGINVKIILNGTFFMRNKGSIVFCYNNSVNNRLQNVEFFQRIH